MVMEYASQTQIREFYAEFGATEDTVKRDVAYLIEWLRKQPHLPSVDTEANYRHISSNDNSQSPTSNCDLILWDIKECGGTAVLIFQGLDEDWLANFLLRGKNDVERTKMLIENYYTARVKMPEIFRNRGTKFFDRIKALRELIIICPLPKLTPDGYRLVMFRERSTNGQVPDPIDTLKYAQMMFDLNLRLDKVRGLTLVYDYENTGLAFVKAFFPVIRRALMIQSKINPVRYNRLYHLNLPTYAQPILSFTASFLRKQMEKMIIWNKKASDLAQEISPYCLPKEYGGRLGTLSEVEDKCFAKFHEYLEWFDGEEKIEADLSKKPVTLISNQTMQGPDGTFRKLCID